MRVRVPYAATQNFLRRSRSGNPQNSTTRYASTILGRSLDSALAHGLWGPVQLAINIRVAHNRLHIFAGFGEWNGFNEFLDVAIFPR